MLVFRTKFVGWSACALVCVCLFGAGSRIAFAQSGGFSLSDEEESPATTSVETPGDPLPEAAPTATAEIAVPTNMALLQALRERDWKGAESRLEELRTVETNATAYVSAAVFAARCAYVSDRSGWAAKQLERAALAANDPALERMIEDSLAWCRFDAGDLQTQESDLWRMAERGGRSPLFAAAVERRSSALVAKERADEAIALNRKFVRLAGPGSESALALLRGAKLLEAAGSKREAIVWCRELLAFDSAISAPRDQALYLIAWCAKDLNEHEESVAAFRELASRYPESRFWNDAACRTIEHDLRKGTSARSAALLETLGAKEDLSRDLRRRVLYAQAQTAIAGSDWKGIEHPIAKLLELDPPDSLRLPAEFWAAEGAYRRRDYELAESRFAKLAETWADRTEGWTAIIALRSAQCAAQRRQWNTALERLDRLTAKHPDYERMFEADFARGRTLLALGRFQEARDALTKCAEFSGGGETAALAQWTIGESFFLQNRFEEAIAAYEKTASRGEYDHWKAASVLQTAKCLERLQRYAEAGRMYAKLLEDYPQSPFAVEAKQRQRLIDDPESLASRESKLTSPR